MQKIVYFLFAVLAVVSIACGVVVTLPTPMAVSSPLADVETDAATHHFVDTTEMIVCHTDPLKGGLYLRVNAGARYPLAQSEPLADGTIVTVTYITFAEDDGIWYQISGYYSGDEYIRRGGFVNSKYVCQ